MQDVERSLIGFDVRVLRGISHEIVKSIKSHHCTLCDPPPLRLSFSRQVWAPHECPDHGPRQNNVNLYMLPDFWGERCFWLDEICLVAFDVPHVFIQTHYDYVGINELPLFVLQGNAQWQFIGFDVVDLYHQVSGLYDLSLNNEDIAQLPSSRINGFGLIDDYKIALDVSDTLDRLRPSNAPFAPCGVWLKIADGSVEFPLNERSAT